MLKRLIEIIRVWWYRNSKLSFSLYSAMPVGFYAENYNQFRDFDRVYFNWQGDNWDSDFSLMPDYYKPLKQFPKKKYYIILKFQDIKFFDRVADAVRQFEYLGEMLGNELSHIAGVVIDTEYIAEHYGDTSLPPWNSIGKLFREKLMAYRKDLDIRVLPIGSQHDYGYGWKLFARGLSPNTYIDEYCYQIVDFASILLNKKDLRYEHYSNVETAVFPLGNPDDYCDKSANYSLDDFKLQIENIKKAGYKECMIYGHGAAWFQILYPNKYVLPWGNTNAYRAYVVDNIGLYYDVIKG